MKLIIAGGRKTPNADYRVGSAILDAGIRLDEIAEVVSGHSGYIDLAGERLAERNGIPVKLFLADWGQHGRAAGPIRNSKMAAYGDTLVAIWDGTSSGTLDMIRKARRWSLQIFVSTTRSP